MGGTADFFDLFRDEPVSVRLGPGEVLFREGDRARSLYVIRRGTLRITRDGRLLEDIGERGIVGEMAVIEKTELRSATVTALTPCELVEIDEERFRVLVRREPEFALSVMRVLSRRLREMNARHYPKRGAWIEP